MTTRISGNAELNLLAPSDIIWLSKPIGEPFPLWDFIAGVEVPPTDNPNYRFVKLTYGDAYNAGVLTNETISGSDPLILSTAQIDLVDSPLNGQILRLINTEKRILRPNVDGTLQDDALQNLTGSVFPFYRAGLATPTGAFGVTQFGVSPAEQGTQGASPGDNATINFDASRVARTANETRMKNIGTPYYIRIL